jgi:hypothetical protein
VGRSLTDIWDDIDNAPGDKILRDGRDRPYVYPDGYAGPYNFDRTKPKGDPRTTYSRASSHGETLEDGTALDRYHQRNVVRGMVAEPALIEQAVDILKMRDPEDAITKQQLNRVADDARKAIYEDEKADIGTFVHLLCQLADEAIMRGESPAAALDIVRNFEGAAKYVDDVAAYLRLTLPIMRPVLVEQFLVTDETKVAGTVDRVNEWLGEPVTMPNEVIMPGDHVVADIKTGGVEYGLGKFAIQFANYAHGKRYDQRTNTRSDLPDPTSYQWGVLIHVPAGTGTAALYWIDIQAGWEAAVNLAGPVREWRNRSKKLLTPFPAPSLLNQVVGALTADEARDLYRNNVNEWTPAMTEIAKGKAA